MGFVERLPTFSVWALSYANKNNKKPTDGEAHIKKQPKDTADGGKKPEVQERCVQNSPEMADLHH